MRYVDAFDQLSAEHLQGFFVGWPNPPSPEKHLELLKKSDYALVAVDETTGIVVGFINAITDHVLCAYIPLLEVLPDYHGRGIGSELVRCMLEKLEPFYMVDLLCDPDLQSFYGRLGMMRSTGMLKRNYARQADG